MVNVLHHHANLLLIKQFDFVFISSKSKMVMRFKKSLFIPHKYYRFLREKQGFCLEFNTVFAAVYGAI